MYEPEPMKKGCVETIFQSDDPQFPSVILVHTLSDYGCSEILVEYACEADEHTFIRWSETQKRDKDSFAHDCPQCESERKQSVMMESCVFDDNPFLLSEEEEVIFRGSGAVPACSDCVDDIRTVVKSAATEDSAEFVAIEM